MIDKEDLTDTEGEKSDRDDEDKDEEPEEEEDDLEPDEQGPDSEKEPEKESEKETKKKPPPAILPKPKPKMKPEGDEPVIISSFKDRTVNEGSLVRLDVVVESDSDVTVEWRLNDDVISSQDFSHFTVLSEGNTQSLLITETRESDSGAYSCLVRNDFGTAEYSAILRVTGE